MPHSFNDFTDDELELLRADLRDYAMGAMAEYLRRVDPSLSPWQALNKVDSLDPFDTEGASR